MLAQRDDYRPEAVATMLEILKERNVPQDAIDTQLAMLEVELKAHAQIADDPLSPKMKWLLIAVPVLGLIAGRFLSAMLSSQGKEQKRADVLKYTILGFLIWTLIIACLQSL